MKTTITIEQFDNGITIIEQQDGCYDNKVVSLEHSKLADIGKIIWANIEAVMNTESVDKVTMEIEFTSK